MSYISTYAPSRCSRTQRPKPNAFTLIELLVVIAIIGILAAILFPVFAQAKAAAKKAACLSNVKQICLATVMYAADYDDYLPSDNQLLASSPVMIRTYLWGELTFDASFNPALWDFTKGLLQPYMKNVKIIDCPTAQNVFNVPAVQRGLAYGVNGQAISFQLRSYSDIARPAETIEMSDQINGTGLGTPYLGCQDFGTTMNNMSDGRHGGFASVGWLDGHAKTFRPSMGGINIPALTSFGANYVSASTATKNGWGYILYPGVYEGGQGTYNWPSAKDCYYYAATKPAGT